MQAMCCARNAGCGTVTAECLSVKRSGPAPDVGKIDEVKPFTIYGPRRLRAHFPIANL